MHHPAPNISNTFHAAVISGFIIIVYSLLFPLLIFPGSIDNSNDKNVDEINWNTAQGHRNLCKIIHLKAKKVKKTKCFLLVEQLISNCQFARSKLRCSTWV